MNINIFIASIRLYELAYADIPLVRSLDITIGAFSSSERAKKACVDWSGQDIAWSGPVEHPDYNGFEWYSGYDESNALYSISRYVLDDDNMVEYRDAYEQYREQEEKRVQRIRDIVKAVQRDEL